MNGNVQTATGLADGDDIGQSRFWLLRVVLPGRRGRWLTGLAIFVVLLSLFGLAGSLSEDGLDRVGFGIALFFSVILAYVVPVHHLIIGRSLDALTTLAKAFPPLAEESTRCQRRLTAKSRTWVMRTLILGVAAGLGHDALLFGGTDRTLALTHVPTILTASLTLLIWIVMTAVISSLVENAMIFAGLGRRVPIVLLDAHSLTPFGRVAASSTLAMIGAQAAFPLMFLQTDVSWVTYVPGLIATAVPMVFLFLAPIWPVHRRLVTTKRGALVNVGERIRSRSTTGEPLPPDLDRLASLLLYRREVAGAPEWPFDTSLMGRLALYLVIPPLTWIGAALIEVLVDTAL